MAYTLHMERHTTGLYHDQRRPSRASGRPSSIVHLHGIVHLHLGRTYCVLLCMEYHQQWSITTNGQQQQQYPASQHLPIPSFVAPLLAALEDHKRASLLS